MHSYLQLLPGTLTLLSWFYMLATLEGARHWQRSRPKPSPQKAMPPVTILIPVYGDDPEQEANFRSFCMLDYPRYQLVFGALDPHDPGLETARRLAKEFPDCHITLVSGGAVHGNNRKVSNLIQMQTVAEYDLLALCDSDMRVTPDYLQRVTAPFADPKVGMVTCLYRGYHARTFAAVMEALGIGASFAPSVLLANRLSGLYFALGATIVLPAAVLESVGGFCGLSDDLADDYLLGKRVHQLGYRIVLSDYVVNAVLGEETFAQAWQRRLRWAKTIRSMQPAGWAGSVITHALPLSLVTLLASGGSHPGWTIFGITLALRGVTACWLGIRYLHDPVPMRHLLLLPLSDLLSFALWLSSFFGKHIVWRGQRFRLLSNGQLEKA